MCHIVIPWPSLSGPQGPVNQVDKPVSFFLPLPVSGLPGIRELVALKVTGTQPGRWRVPITGGGSVTAHRARSPGLSKKLLNSETHEPYGQETPPQSSAFSKDSVSGSYSFIGFLSLDYDCYNDTTNHV